ncbi:MAG: hypothetical protein M5U19_14325 [Microthrixaceae bacterium]|nr:hypothetical protein [Microthrixaceae bacterium]
MLAAAAPLLGASRAGRRLLAASSVVYCAMLTAALATSQPADHGADTTTFLAAFPVMHLTWGAGFLVGLARPR